MTISVNTAGVIESKDYAILVNGTTPKFASLSQKTIRSCDYTDFLINYVSDYAVVKVSCNKNIKIGAYNPESDKEKKFTVGKTAKNVGRVSNIIVYPTSTTSGNVKLTVSIEQDGKVKKKTYTIKVFKYVNPIKSFTIGGKEYAGKFNKKSSISDGNGLTIKECNATLGGKSFKLQMKKGYTLVSITYRNVGEWGTTPHKLKSTSTKLPTNFFELYITYKDKNGKKWTNTIFYSLNVDGLYKEY